MKYRYKIIHMYLDADVDYYHVKIQKRSKAILGSYWKTIYTHNLGDLLHNNRFTASAYARYNFN